MKLRYLWVAVALMTASQTPLQASADAYVSPEPSNIARLVYAYCAPPGPREALSRRHRANARWSLEYARTTHEQRWQELPDDLRTRANRIIDERTC